MQRSFQSTLLAIALILGAAAPAYAVSIPVRIVNTSNVPWSDGLLTLQPLIGRGIAPGLGSNEYFTYAFANSHCNIADAHCSSASCDDGDASTLAARWGFSLGTSAWLVPALDAGEEATVMIEASPGDELSYVSWISLTSYFDDMVAAHVVGDQDDMSVPLFDGDDLPLTHISFAISSYDVNSLDEDTGEAGTCAAECPPPGTAGCYVSPGNHSTSGDGSLPSQPTPDPDETFTRAWTVYESGYYTDGIALGNMTNASGREVVVLLEGSADYSDPDYVYTGTGRMAVYSRAGSPQSAWAAPGGTDLLGLPLVTNLDGGGRDEYLACTPYEGGACYARGASGGAEWTSSPYGWSGWWNMGPSAGDLRTNVANDEIVVVDWNGEIRVLNSASGAVVNTFNTFASLDANPSLSEPLAGHATIANVDGVSGNEVVVAGFWYGKVMAMKTNNADGVMSLVYASDPLPGGAHVEGSGPAVADIDGDGEQEIIVLSADGADVYAYSVGHGAGCKYHWSTAAGSGYWWTMPAIGDVDDDGDLEIVVLSPTAVLSVLSAPSAGGGCRNGVVEWETRVGTSGASWFTPALAQVTGGAGLDIVAADYFSLEVIDGETRELVYRFSDASANFYPTAVIDRGTRSGSTPGAHIYTTGWANGAIYRFDTLNGGPRPERWTGYGANDQRTGLAP